VNADVATNPRQSLSARQARTVARLLDAGLEQIREVGYEELSLRTVAARAGVTHTTAYSYFSSKAHLVVAIFWDHIEALPDPVLDPGAPLGDRLSAALHDPGRLFLDEPELTEAASAALLRKEPDIRRIRDQVGGELARRIGLALGQDADPWTSEIVLMAFSGGMLEAGMGYFDFAGVVERMRRLGELVERARGAPLGRRPGPRSRRPGTAG
jgi:AcrR family transcriptional regulator